MDVAACGRPQLRDRFIVAGDQDRVAAFGLGDGGGEPGLKVLNGDLFHDPNITISGPSLDDYQYTPSTTVVANREKGRTFRTPSHG